MEVVQFLKYLKGKQIDLKLKGDKLEVNFDGDHLPDEVIHDIRERKQEIMAFLHQISSDTKKEEAIPVAPIQEDYALSAAQQSLWIINRLENDSKAYNMHGTYKFKGDLNVSALERAFAALIERHEILRTVFRVNDQGLPRQVVLSPETCGHKFNTVDLTESEDSEAEMKSQLSEVSREPFDLGEGPLLRVTLYKHSDQDYFLSYMLHHILTDGWSMKVMLKDVMTLYAAFDAGQENPMAPLRIQYKDYSEWQKEQLNGDNLANHRSFWENQFQGEIPILNVEGDFSRPLIKTSNGGNIGRVMKLEVFNGLKQMVQANGATLFVHLLAAVNTLLFKLSNQTDIIVGTPIAGRPDADLESQIGIYLNTLAIRSKFEKSDSFNELIEKIKEVAYSAFEHQVYPFEALVDSVSIPKDLSRNPLFDTMVVLQNTPEITSVDLGETSEENAQDASLTMERMGTFGDSESQFDLSFEFTELEDSIGINLAYNSDIFKSETATRFLDYLETIIGNVVLNPNAPIREISMVSEKEQNWQLETVNQIEHDYPNETVISLFNKQVLENPDKEAVKFEDKSLTYAELNSLSTEFAGFLQARGVEKGSIGLQVHRSEWMFVAIWGILKTGSAYVPIDLSYPKDRVDYILENCECSLLVTDELMNEFIASKSNVPTYAYKEVAIGLDDSAYVIYTSGSTGRPKGVLIGHRSVTNLLFALNPIFNPSKEDKVLNLNTISFDISIAEIFFPFVNGMTVVLADDSVRHDPEQIVKLINEEQISTIQLTPSRLNILLQRDDFFPEKTLTRMIVAGEAFRQDLFDQLMDRYSGEVFNGYGPTEACVYTSIRSLKKGDRVDIGQPIGNTKVYIFNDDLHLQPAGVIGELYIGGDCLAKGYVNREELTNERFIQNPFDPQTRLYRTGDLARWTKEGNLEYFGRTDNQVKIRGYRIELKEIESVLKEIPAVKDAVVVAIHQPDSGAALAAYVTSDQEPELTLMRSFLATKLPDFMVPEYFVFLESLPINTNGKIDFSSLPDPLGHAVKNTVEYIDAESKVEKQLVEIWKEILKQEKIGVLDNFFDLGGNSIKIIMLVDTINRELNKQVNYISAFQYPNIRSFAEYLEQDSQFQIEEVDEQIDRSIDVMDETLNFLNDLD